MIEKAALLGALALPLVVPFAGRADVVAPDGRVIDCYCTDTQGARVELEQVICLYVDGRAFMAKCDMSLNVPTWRDTGQGCLSSGLIQRLQRLEPTDDAGLVDATI